MELLLVKKNRLGNITWSIKNWITEEIEYKIKQRTFKVSLDELIEFWKFFIPSYLKIDFDGIENMIIRILIKKLKNPKLNSVLIEINRKRKEDLEIISILENSGFKFDQK